MRDDNRPRDRIVVYYPDRYPDPRSRYPYQGWQPPDRRWDRPPARRRPGPPFWIWPGIPIAGALFVLSQIMIHPGARPHKTPAAPAPAPPAPRTIIIHDRPPAPAPPAHPMPGWEAIGITLLIVVCVLGVVSLLVHAYRSRS